MAELEDINKSGELIEIKLGGSDAEKILLTKEQIEALIPLLGNYTFDSVYIDVDSRHLIAGTSTVSRFLSNDQQSYLNATDYNIYLRAGDGSTYRLLEVREEGIFARNVTVEMIDNASSDVILTREWAEERLRANKVKVTGATQSGSAIILQVDDDGKYLTTGITSAFTMELPNTVDFPTGFSFMLELAGVGGSVTFNSPINIRSANGNVLSVLYNAVRIIKSSSTSWTISGILTP